MRGGSSSLSSSASTFIKRSLGLKRVSDKHCVSESKKLVDIFSKLKSSYILLEREHKKQLKAANDKQREYTSEARSAQVNLNRVSIRETAYLGYVTNINQLRESMNEIYNFVKQLRCVLVKYLFTKVPSELAPVFEEYST